MTHRHPLALLLLSTLAACMADDEPVASAQSTLVAQCAPNLDALPSDAWSCPDEHVVECSDPSGTPVDTIYVAPPGRSCVLAPQLDVEPGPFPLGETKITVTAGPDEVCQATLVVADTTPPAATPHTIELWPPNHKWHTIGVDDCVTVTDACDDDVHVRFTHVSSDEAPNATGDGNTEPDIDILACDQVRLRAERQGGGNGRVYLLAYLATDAAGNTTEGTCRVAVPHDQGANGQAVMDPSATATTIAACGP